ncbi:MAG: DUF222 domain-containing protein [Acidimicrobiales bacterium]
MADTAVQSSGDTVTDGVPGGAARSDPGRSEPLPADPARPDPGRSEPLPADPIRSDPALGGRYGSCTDDELCEAIGQIYGAEMVMRRQLMEMVATYEARGAFVSDGARTMAAWLVERLGLSHFSARELARASERLGHFPGLSKMIGAGALSWDMAVAALDLADSTGQDVTLGPPAQPDTDDNSSDGAPDDFADADNPADADDPADPGDGADPDDGTGHHGGFVDFDPSGRYFLGPFEVGGLSAANLARLARRMRHMDPSRSMGAHRDRHLSWRSGSDGTWRVSGQLADVEGAVVAKALSSLAEGYGPEPETGRYESFGARCADALVELAGAVIGADAEPDRATVVIHVQDQVLSGIAGGSAEVAEGGAISGESARRLACDGRYSYVADGLNGSALGVGRTTRSIPPWLYRVLRHRDGGCRFPGCGQTRLIHAHHVRHWANGGPTDQGNLLLLCRYHHRLAHEGGWSITGDACGELRFIRPDSSVLDPRRSLPQTEVLTRLFGGDGRDGGGREDRGGAGDGGGGPGCSSPIRRPQFDG